MTLTLALFYIFAVTAVACAFAMLLSRNPVYGAIYLIETLIAIAGIFMVLDAPFLAVLQVLVYAGAIMVLYLFVIMLLNIGHIPGFRWWRNWRTYAGTVLTGLVVATALQRGRYDVPPITRGFSVVQVRDVARLMFRDPLLLFLVEALSVLLLIAIVGAIHLGRRYTAEEKAKVDREIAESGFQPREGTA